METRGTNQECAPKAEPQKEHRWLEKLVGEWTFEGEATMAPDKPPEKFRGIERVRSIGGLWIQAEGQGEMPGGGGAATTITTLGYDPHRKRFVGTFVASMMTHLWLYDGSLDAAERVLTLDTEGHDMSAEGKMAKYQDVIESDDHRVLRSRVLPAAAPPPRPWHRGGRRCAGRLARRVGRNPRCLAAAV